MKTLSEPDTYGSGIRRWPATLHPDRAERCYYTARDASRRWVDGLATRTGVPRWSRIKRCGDPVATWHAGTGALAWEHRWCRDRACYACARSRSRRLATSLRAACERRETAPLYFLTLTRPRVRGEDARTPWRHFQRCWEALRHTPEFKLGCTGGVRNMEATDGADGGWHVHAHTIVELVDDRVRVACPACDGRGRHRGLRCRTCSSATVKGDGKMPAALRDLIVAWTRITGGSVRAQCGVTLNKGNAGQLAKYLTKLWELPPERARTLFAAVVGKRIVEGFGTWRRWQRWGAVERSPRGWYGSRLSVRAIEAMGPHERVEFVANLPGAHLEPGIAIRRRGERTSKFARYGKGAAFTPTVPVASVPASTVLAALRRDARPTWERAADALPENTARAQAVADALRAKSRREYRGHVVDPPPRHTWEW